MKKGEVQVPYTLSKWTLLHSTTAEIIQIFVWRQGSKSCATLLGTILILQRFNKSKNIMYCRPKVNWACAAAVKHTADKDMDKITSLDLIIYTPEANDNHSTKKKYFTLQRTTCRITSELIIDTKSNIMRYREWEAALNAWKEYRKRLKDRSYKLTTL